MPPRSGKNIRPLVVAVAAVVLVHVAVLGTIWLVKGPPPWNFENVPPPVEFATMLYLRLVLVVVVMAYGMILLSPFTISVTVVVFVVRWLLERNGRGPGSDDSHVPRGLSG